MEAPLFSPDHYWTALGLGMLMALGAAVAGAFTTTPYGRFGSDKLGPSVPIRLGWVLMEAPAVLAFVWFFPQGPRALEPVPLLFAGVWAIHYTNRAILFPWLMKARPGSRMSVSVFGSGWVVTTLHAWLYATWFSTLGDHLTTDWLTDPRFVVGLPLYALGLGLILHTEHLLRRLRATPRPEGQHYVVPQGGGFRWVTNPHYLGEILAWTGLMLASWCPGGLFVWSITLANLVPRALATHRWYHETFPDYPSDRRVLLPGLW